MTKPIQDVRGLGMDLCRCCEKKINHWSGYCRECRKANGMRDGSKNVAVKPVKSKSIDLVENTLGIKEGALFK